MPLSTGFGDLRNLARFSIKRQDFQIFRSARFKASIGNITQIGRIAVILSKFYCIVLIK